MLRTSSRGTRVKRELPGDSAMHSPSPLAHRQASITPRPVQSFRGQDQIMTGTEHPSPGSAHPNLHEELVAAARSARVTPLAVTPDLTSDDQESVTDRGYGPDASGIDVLGRQSKALIETINRLQSLGVEVNDLTLPKIIVVGDQSAGKSSLIEGISKIKVPRSAGTCTRCPLRITLTPTDQDDMRWSCTITIQKQYDHYSSVPVDSTGKKSPFGNWVAKDEAEEIAFASTHSEIALEDLISRAQYACLNPGDSVAKYLTTVDVADLPQAVQFSPNIVHLKIKSPLSPSLSFVDLPGVINQTENASDLWLVKLVKNLVRKYISQPNTLILLACSMESDMANSNASKLVLGCPGAQERCVGVMTKPDRLPAGDRYEEISKILAKEIFPQGHGWFVTMQPNQDKLNRGITADEARVQEAAFFVQHPWSTVLSTYNDLFGTAQLQMALSQKLAELILTSLPGLSCRIDERINRVDQELRAYPEPPVNPLGVVLEALALFRSSTERHIEGNIPYNEFRNNVKAVAGQFMKDMKKLRPTLSTASPCPLVQVLSDDEDDEYGPSTPLPSLALSSTKKRKLEPDSTTSSKFRTPQRPGSKLSIGQENGKKAFTLTEICETLNNNTKSYIAGAIDPSAVDKLRLQCLANWKFPMEAFIKNAEELVGSKLHQLLEDSCAQRTNTPFFREASKILKGFVKTVMKDARVYAERALRLECYKPFTLMEDKEMIPKQKVELEAIRNHRYKTRCNEFLDMMDARSKKVTKPEDRPGKFEGLRSQLGADPFQREIEVMAEIRSYYDVAQLRFVDHVAQGIQIEALDKCCVDLHQQLQFELGLSSAPNANEYCARLLEEDPGRAAHRRVLKGERERLLEAKQQIANLDTSGL